MNPEWDRQAIVDWALTFLAVIVAASLLADSGPPRSSDHASISAVRELEFRAQMEVYPTLREQMGVGELDMLTEVLDELVRSDLTSPDHLLVTGTLALIVERDGHTLEALDQLAQRPSEALQTVSKAALQLDDLAKKRAGPIDALNHVIQRAGGSDWLMLSLKALDAERRGEPSIGNQAKEDAQAYAFSFVNSIRSIGGLGFTLCLLGCLLITFWPMVRRALSGAGLHGLGEAPSPFIIGSTHRVMIVWFLGHIALAGTLSTAVLALGGTPQSQALNVTMQSLLGGGLGLWLIQHWGRRDQDMVVLWIPLRLGFSPSSGGPLGLVAWVIGGLSVGLILVITGTLLSAVTLGESNSTQGALELFSENRSFEVRAALAVSAVVFAPIFEEIIFRGFLYRNMRDILGKTPAMLLTGFLFALVHLDLNLLFPLTGLGFALCLLFERSGSLLAPILVHAAWNLSQLAILSVLVAG
ncbi:MAG: lysostaphin resistance A-like protein [Myxococcota bacterium]